MIILFPLSFVDVFTFHNIKYMLVGFYKFLLLLRLWPPKFKSWFRLYVQMRTRETN